MDLVLYKGTLQNSEVSLGLMKSKKTLAFEKDGKYLFPRDKQKQIIELSDDFDLAKIKKTTKETNKALEYYLGNPELEKTAFGIYLIEYYVKEISNKDLLFEELEEDGQEFFKPLLERFLKLRYYKNSAFYPNYYKESKVLARFAFLDIELIFGTIIRDVDDLLFKDKKPISIFPLRYSTSEVKDEDLEKIVEISGGKIAQWFKWRNVLRKAPFLYNHIIHWLNEILEILYPEDEESLKDVSQDAERAEVLSKADILGALQQGEDFEAEDFSSASLNKHILSYYSMQFLYGEKQLTFKKYNKTPSFGYQDIFVSMSSIYTSLPLFTSFNPTFSMIAGGLIEWIEKKLEFAALQGNRQLDPYNIIPNAFSFYLAILFSKTGKIKERKYLLAKSLEKLLTKDVLKEGLKWQKQSTLAMQGKDAEQANIEVSDEEADEKMKEIKEILSTYVKELKMRSDKKTELNVIIDEMGIIDKNYDEIKDDKDEFLKVKDEYKELLSPFQKDFILSIQLFEKDAKILNTIAQLFDFINKYILVGSSNALYGFSLLLWMSTISNNGSLKWLLEKTEDIVELEEEGRILASISAKYNTALQGFKIRGYPLIETTAPTVIIQTTQNLSELLIARDVSEQETINLYPTLLKNLKEIYSS